jgi:hypothetical protein
MDQSDPILLLNTKEWLLRAKEDLDAAGLVPNAPSPLVRTALFHSQASSRKGHEGLTLA